MAQQQGFIQIFMRRVNMSHKERYEDTKWRYENHFKDDDTKESLINDADHYIKSLEQEKEELEIKLEELS